MNSYSKIRQGIGVFLFLSLFFLPLAHAQSAAIWWGNVTLGTNTSTNGANVSAYTNGAIIFSRAVGSVCNGPGCVAGVYTLDVPCTRNDNITLTVYNITANSSQACNLGVKTLLNLSVSKLANDAVCAYSQACSGGYCCSGATEYNGNGIGACQSSACSAPAAGGSSGGGGGGGGGGAAASQTSYTGSVPAGESKSVKFTKDELKITSVEITTTEAVNNIGVTVKESSEPAGNIAISSSEGKAYKYLEITKSVEDKSISQAKISFKVEKSWFEANKLNPATTVLKKLVNNIWQDLPTSKVKEDATYVYFESVSGTLSLFAITAKKQEVKPVVSPNESGEVKPYCGDAVCDSSTENCESCVQDCTCKSGEDCRQGICVFVPPEKKPGISPQVITAFVFITLLLIVLGIIIFKRKKS